VVNRLRDFTDRENENDPCTLADLKQELMLVLNLKDLLKLKGRSDARIFLVSKLKLSYSKARKLTNGSLQMIWIYMIEDLCEELDCKKADLFEYIPDKGRLIPGLVELIRDPNMRTWVERLEDKSVE
jgi:DNA-binding Xre family transcriptional regulator